jgi:hypothetical protein
MTAREKRVSTGGVGALVSFKSRIGRKWDWRYCLGLLDGLDSFD